MLIGLADPIRRIISANVDYDKISRHPAGCSQAIVVPYFQVKAPILTDRSQ